MRVFVTGGAGFIGSHYVRQVLTDAYPAFAGAEVTVFDKLTYAGNLDNLASVSDSPRYRFVRGDLVDGALLDRELPGHDVVVNFAAETHVDRSITGAQDFVVTNVLGAQTLFDACLRNESRGWCTSAPTRSTARSPRARGPRTSPCCRTAPTRRPRRAPSCCAGRTP
jgi:dTDP-glucose 4,6-dehydratase